MALRCGTFGVAGHTWMPANAANGIPYALPAATPHQCGGALSWLEFWPGDTPRPRLGSLTASLGPLDADQTEADTTLVAGDGRVRLTLLVA